MSLKYLGTKLCTGVPRASAAWCLSTRLQATLDMSRELNIKLLKHTSPHVTGIPVIMSLISNSPADSWPWFLYDGLSQECDVSIPLHTVYGV